MIGISVLVFLLGNLSGLLLEAFVFIIFFSSTFGCVEKESFLDFIRLNFFEMFILVHMHGMSKMVLYSIS